MLNLGAEANLAWITRRCYKCDIVLVVIFSELGK